MTFAFLSCCTRFLEHCCPQITVTNDERWPIYRALRLVDLLETFCEINDR